MIERNQSFEVLKRQQFEDLHKKKKSCFTRDQLIVFEEKGMPEPPLPEKLIEITANIYERFHENNVTCAVCNQFVRQGRAKLLTTENLPPNFFSILQAPKEISGSELHLNATLLSQYDVSPLFPLHQAFKNVLLSPDGVLTHLSNCTNDGICKCVPHLHICNHTGMRTCFANLKKGKLPKFSIANGNWVGHLPSDLSDLTYGSRSIMRPVQTFGRIVSFSGNSGPGGASLKGHVYSTRLKTDFVRQKVPIVPGQTPVRVLVVSPFSSDASAFDQGKLASTKNDYIIEPLKLRRLHQFWKDVNNKVMENIDFDEAAFVELPDNTFSPDVFIIEKKK